jgi:hypothetical protein
MLANGDTFNPVKTAAADYPDHVFSFTLIFQTVLSKARENK